MKPVRMERSELKDYYKKEIKRVVIAIKEAEDKLSKLTPSTIFTQNTMDIKNLKYAIAVGNIYFKSLEKKSKEFN